MSSIAVLLVYDY